MKYQLQQFAEDDNLWAIRVGNLEIGTVMKVSGGYRGQLFGYLYTPGIQATVEEAALAVWELYQTEMEG